MRTFTRKWSTLVMTTAVATALGAAASPGVGQTTGRQVGTSPWGEDDQLGRLNLMTPASRGTVMSRIAGGAPYDLSVDYFIGMPSWQAAGDPHYRIWMTHTPHGTVVDDPLGVGVKMNEHVSYTGAAVSMYTHMGTHIDALSHFGLNGRIYNGFRADEQLGDRGWKVAGASTIPPIVARGVLIDVAAAHGVSMLPPGYRIGKDDLVLALDRQGVALEPGDVVLIRTGRMTVLEDAAAYMDNPPGIGMEAARYLVEESGAMIVGADNLSLEAFPSELDDDYVPVHTYLLGEQGAPILELVNLEELSRDQVWEFAFVGGSLKLRGADAAPIRPMAFPLAPALPRSGTARESEDQDPLDAHLVGGDAGHPVTPDRHEAESVGDRDGGQVPAVGTYHVPRPAGAAPEYPVAVEPGIVALQPDRAPWIGDQVGVPGNGVPGAGVPDAVEHLLHGPGLHLAVQSKERGVPLPCAGVPDQGNVRRAGGGQGGEARRQTVGDEDRPLHRPSQEMGGEGDG